MADSDSDISQMGQEPQELLRKIYLSNSQNDRIEKIKKAIEEGIDVNIKDLSNQGNTFLHSAVHNNEIEVVQFLLENRANIYIKNSNGHIPIDLVSSQPKLSEQRKRQKIVDLLSDAANYVTGRLKMNMHESIILTLIMKHPLNQSFDFRLAPKVKAAGAFDDVVLRQKRNEQCHYHYLQAKHSEDKNKRITHSELIKNSTGDFSLFKYITDYLNIQGRSEFKNKKKHFTLYTNAKLNVKDLKKNGTFTPIKINNSHDFLIIKNCIKRHCRYRLKINETSAFYEKLRNNPDAYELAKVLANRTKGSGRLDLVPEIFKRYHTALAQEVIDRKNMKFHIKFISGHELSASAKKFREIFIEECPENLWIDKKFSLSNSFGLEEEAPLELPIPISAEEIKDFFNRFTLAVNQPSEVELKQIIKDEIKSKIKFNLLEIDSAVAVNYIQKQMLNWFAEKRGRLSFREAGLHYFNEATAKINTMLVTGTSIQFMEKLERDDISFDIKQLQILLEDAWQKQRVLHVVTEYPRLKSIKVCQFLRGIPQYQPFGRVLFATLDSLLRHTTQPRLLHAFGTPKRHNLFVIECDTSSIEGTDSILQSLTNTIKESTDKRIILLAPKEHPFVTQLNDPNYEITQVFDDLHPDFDDLTPKSKKTLLKTKVTFQGFKVSLEELISETDRNLTATLPLEKLIKGEQIIIDKPIPISWGYDEDFYISRRLNQQVIKREIFKDMKKFRDLIAFDQSQFEQSYQNHQQRNIHWLHKLESRRWVLKQSHGSLANLRKYIDTGDDESYTTQSILNHMQEDQGQHVMIITDPAGTGKTTTLTHLSKKIKTKNPSYWVARIDLNDHTKILFKQKKNEFTFDEAIKFVATKLLKLKKNFEEKLFEFLLKEQKVVLMLDGFDEICPDCEDIVIGLLRGLTERTLIRQLWITTRLGLKEKLEDTLHNLSYTLEPFSDNDQETFVVKFWEMYLENDVYTYNLEFIESYAKTLVKKLTNSINYREREFIGVPLQIRMLAETFQAQVKACLERSENTLELPDKLSLPDLYKKYIEEKYRIHQDDKLEMKIIINKPGVKTLVKIIFKVFNEIHRRLAIECLFNEDQAKILLSSATNITYPNDDVSRIGLIWTIKKDTIHFFHRTFAEYFIADFLIKQLQLGRIEDTMKDFILTEIFVKGEHATIRKFINEFWEKDDRNYPLEPVRKLFGKRIDELWTEDKKCTRTKKQLSLSGEGVLDGTILAIGVRESNVKIVKFLLDALRERKCHKTLKGLILHTDEYGSVYHRAGWEPEELDALEEIIQVFFQEPDITEEDFLKLLKATDNNGRNVIHRIARWGRDAVLDEIFKAFEKLSIDTKHIEYLLLQECKFGQTVWQRVGRGGNVKILNKLLQWCERSSIAAEKIKHELLINKKGLTTFHQAIKWGHKDILDRLLIMVEDEYVKISVDELREALLFTDDKGNKEKKNGRTIFHRAMYDNPDNVLEKKDCNCEKRQLSRIEVLDMILSKFCSTANLSPNDIKKLLEQKNQIGNIALHLAVKKLLIEETAWLANKMKDYGANLDEKNDGRETALMWIGKRLIESAARSSAQMHVDIAVKLIDCGADINNLDYKSCIVLKKLSDKNNKPLLQKIKQRLLALQVENVGEGPADWFKGDESR